MKKMFYYKTIINHKRCRILCLFVPKWLIICSKKKQKNDFNVDTEDKKSKVFGCPIFIKKSL